jgi:ferredoxin-nitrite reductase
VLEGFGIPAGLYYRLNLGGITGHKDFARSTGVAVPLEDAVRVADAVLRAFIAHGDRTDRKKARLKYLLDKWGHARFLEEVEAVLGQKLPRFDVASMERPPATDRLAHVGVHAQRQEGLSYLGVVATAARIGADQLRGLAEIARKHGNGELRLTVWQNLLIPCVADVPAAQEALQGIGLTTDASSLRAGLVACTGSVGCKFAAADTKGTGQQILTYLEGRITLDTPLNIHLTGCHHSCAQHYIADIGLLGAKVERGDDMLPGYDIHVGGGSGAEAKIGRLIRPAVVAEEVPPLLLNLLHHYTAGRGADESFQAFCARHEDAALNGMLGA